MSQRTLSSRSSTILLLLAAVSITEGHVASATAGSESARTPQSLEDRLTLDLYLQMQSVGSPQLSPDGSRIVYTKSWTDAVNDRRRSELWAMDADGSHKRKLLEGGSAQWSPDGTRIAYVAEGEPRGNQIWVRWMDAEGSTSQITHLERSPSALRWSPDSTVVAFQMTVQPDNDNWRISMPRQPQDAKWTEDPRIVERAVYRRDRRGFIDDGYRHIFVVSADGGPARQITNGNFDYGAPNWSPDGTTIYFSGLLAEDAEYQHRESEVYALDVATGRTTQLTHRRGQDSGPTVSPDGSLIAYTGADFRDQTYYERQLYVMDANGTNVRNLTPDLDRSGQIIDWAPDGSGVFISVSESGNRNIYFVSLAEGPVQLTSGNQMLSVSDMVAGRAVATRSSYHQPGDIVIFDVRNPHDFSQLTNVHANILERRKLGAVERIQYTSTDDLLIEGWVIKPPDFDASRKYPLILAIHGGPHGMYNVGFNFAWQNHAANDYVVLYTNPRGSSGYGTDFGNAINRAYPDKDFDDLMFGVDNVVGQGYIDERNMYVYGCSGGGVLTAWVVGHTDRFAAASSNCPVINWMSFVGTTDGISWYRNFDELPWVDPSEHLRRSPLMYVGNVKTPTMLMTGINDLRTPISQTEEFYAALKVLKVPTAMVRFNDEWHGTSSKPSNYLRTQLYLRHWFERYMTNDAAPKMLRKATATDGENS